MPIVCGTDFTDASVPAVTVASQLAARLSSPLHLVHVVDLGLDESYQAPRSALVSVAEARLQQEAERLRAAGAQVQVHVKGGAPDEALRTLAEELEAQLIVVGALGQRRGGGWQLGSHADRTVQRSPIPVLVVRNSAPFEAWAPGGRPLRIVLGVDASLSSEAAGQWISELSKYGPCEVVLTHLYWPPAEFQRLGLGGVRSWVDPDAEVTRSLEQEYAERFAPLFAATNVTCRIEPHLGRLGDALASLATEENADLVVVGCRNRGPLARMWEGSVSQRTLRLARTSVACIPAPLQVETQAVPAIRSVLVPTDFSATGRAAIPLAYSALGSGGTVHLLHVLKSARDAFDASDLFTPKGPSEQVEAARAELAQWVPKAGVDASVSTRIHVVEASDTAAAICQAAERLGVDLICLGTHGRSGVSRALLGSIAAAVLSGTRRPVLLARAPLV